MTFPFPLLTKFSPLKIAFYLAILLIVVVAYNTFYGDNRKRGVYEGFTQDKPFVLKQDNDVYDDFYIDIYDTLNATTKRAEYDVNRIIEVTKMDTGTATVLDVGCGTGCLVGIMSKKGINIKGIDKSQSMINYAQRMSNGGQFAKMEAEDPVAYGQAEFTHILCLYMTIYEIRDKMGFFRNAYYGLHPGGYLVIHLVKGEDYNAFIDLAKPKALDEEWIVDEGIKSMETDFGGFTYRRDWTDIYVLKETFTDHDSECVRENEVSRYYEPIETILEQCKRCGFGVYSAVEEDKVAGGGMLYFLVKPGIYKNISISV